ncbi:MAG: decaprenyl-phosphate phosphoribosyltransferase [Dyadobacter sp.]|uniref:decaprenyl-phosphate phosphoribosyltransferase n=1 Tax=Dyadobacter sp. TaxID=1914288 RepID=UPI003267DD62
MISLVLREIRIYQWIKNLLIFAPLIFSRKLFDQTAFVDASLAFFAYCMAASAIYVINDLKDVESDRLHPVKKHRPLASGRLSRPVGIALVVACTALCSVLLAVLNDGILMMILLAYCVINVLYSLYFKNISIIDCFFIAFGFELRIIAGCKAINVLPSDFILVVTFFLALMLGFVKRKGELKVLSQNAESHRKVLADYSIGMMDKFIYSCSTMTLISYMFYTIDKNVINLVGHDYLKYSLIFVVYGLFRFVQLADIDKFQGEGDPTTLIYKDKPVQLTLALYLVFVLFCFYGHWI